MSAPAPAPPSPLPAPFKLRATELRNVQPIVCLIRELAEFEQLTHLLQVTPGKLRGKEVTNALGVHRDSNGTLIPMVPR